MISLNPSEQFTIFRGISDHTDSGTYYIRAIIKNARTNTLIDTVNLTDLGNRQFSKDWTIPADSSGQGFWIVITTTVYSDSGYTTKATAYGEEFDTYLIFDRKNPWLGAGGGADIDYKKIKLMIDEAISKIVIPEVPEQKETDLTIIINSLSFLKNLIENIKFPEQKETDLKPVFNAIKGIYIPEPIKTDLTPVLSKIDGSQVELEEKLKQVLGFIVEKFNETITEHKEYMGKIEENVNQQIIGFRSGLSALGSAQPEIKEKKKQRFV